MPSRNDNRTPWPFGVFAVRMIAVAALASLLGTQDRAEARMNRGAGDGIVLYVDDDAPAGGDGQAWKKAYRYLQDALDASREPGSKVTEIRVAGGVYRPDQGANVILGDVHASLEMVSGLALRGGYAGYYSLGNTALTAIATHDPDQRDFEQFESILKGDLLGNDGPPGSFANYDDNSFHVMTLANPAPSTILEGLTFTASNADFRPGTAAFGGGLHCEGGSLTITQCVFRLNEAYSGGGLYSHDTDLTLRHSLFERNHTVGLDWHGGGAQIDGGDIVVEDSTFVANSSAVGDAGGLYAVADSVHVSRCNFLYNGADRGGGAALGANAVAIDCSFVGNNAADSGGGLWGGALRVNCNFVGNYAGQYAAGFLGAQVSIGCTFQGNATGFEGGGGFAGGGTFINCSFLGNSCAKGVEDKGGAAGWVRSSGGASFSNCLFSGNNSDGAGGAIFVNPALPAAFKACTFVNNITATGIGGAIAGHGTIGGSILWNNVPAELDGDFAVTFSCIDNSWPGLGNISSDPRFLNALGPDGIAGTNDDNLRLLAGSSCIDAGDNTALPLDAHDLDEDGNLTEPLPLDLDRQPRIVNDPAVRNTGQPPQAAAIVDMGAFEFADFEPLPGDANGDGLVNVDDLVTVILSWGECPNLQSSCQGDLDGDGEVGVSDLVHVIVNWS